jgi:hypothetical protein
MKTKHAKGPDGKPLISINSGRGRGRPKKNAGRLSNQNVITDEFFRTIDKVGGPLDPTDCFAEVYTEIYIKLAKKVKPEEMEEDRIEEGDEGEEGEEVEEGEESKQNNKRKAGSKNQQPLDEDENEEESEAEDAEEESEEEQDEEGEQE